MSEPTASNAEKATKPDTKQIADVAHPGKSAPSDTSRPVIVRSGPILQDPMMVEASGVKDVKKVEPDKTSTKEAVIQPLGAPVLENETKDTPVEVPKAEETKVEKPVPEKVAEPAKPDKKVIAPIEPLAPEEPKAEEPEAEKPQEPSSEEKAAEAATDAQTTPAQKDASKEAEQAKKQAAVQKLIESKKYSLPINSVEQRKSKRFIVLGILLSLLLAAAWLDIALDAGLIELNGIKALTDFF